MNWLENENNFAIFDDIQEIIEQFIRIIQESQLDLLKMLSKRLRDALWNISIQSGVEVLPVNIKNILDDIEDNVEQVVFSSVPGAGGHDAFYFIVNINSWEDGKNLILARNPELVILNVK